MSSPSVSPGDFEKNAQVENLCHRPLDLFSSTAASAYPDVLFNFKLKFDS